MQSNPQNRQPRPEVTPTVAEKPVHGIVTDCLRLNVRKEPEIDAEVVTVIPALSKVTVDLDASTETFYKIRTAVGVEGFCMKKFIAIRR